MEPQTKINPQPNENILNGGVNNRLGNNRNVVLHSLIMADSGTIARFGRKVGFGRSHLSQIVNNLKVPTNAEMIKIAAGLNQDSRTIWPDVKQ